MTTAQASIMIRFVKLKFSYTVADKSFISFMVLNLTDSVYLFYLTSSSSTGESAVL